MWTKAALAVVTGSLALGCGSSPEPTYFALAPTRGTVATLTSSDAGTAIKSLKIRRPGLAGYLDRPEIVKRVADYRLGVTANERWGEPLDVMVARVLAQDLEERLPDLHAFTEDGAITSDPDATLEVDVQRFDIGDDGQMTLVAEVAVEKGSGHTALGTKSVRLKMAPTSTATGELVHTMSTLLGQLSDQVATVVRGK